MAEKVSYSYYYNQEKKRVEFLLKNFDYYDGIDLLADLFRQEFGLRICDAYDGIWFRIIHIGSQRGEYELLWHEDTGNEILCIYPSAEANNLLQNRLERIVELLNNSNKSSL